MHPPSRSVPFLLVVALVCACSNGETDDPITGGSSSNADAKMDGVSDGGTTKPDVAAAKDTAAKDTAGPVDAGPKPVDAGPKPVDAGPKPVDAGPKPVDAGPVDKSLGLGSYYGGKYNEETPALDMLPDGGAYLAGYTESAGAGGWDVLVIRTNACGKPTWTRTYGSAGKDEAQGIAALPDGGAWVVGSSDGFGGQSEALILRIDAKGVPKYAHVHGGPSFEAALDVAASSDKGAIVVAKTYSFGPGTPDSHNMMALRVGATGKLIWGKAIGGAKDGDAGFAVIALANKSGATTSYVFAGATESFGIADDDIWVMKMDTKGKHLWSKAYGSPDDDEARGLVATSSGGLAVVGFTKGFGALKEDAMVLSLDGAGKLLWGARLVTAGEDRAYDVIESKGSLGVVGRTDGFGSGDDGFLTWWTGKGKLAWARRAGGSKGRQIAAVRHAKDGSIAMSGYANNAGAGGREGMLVRTNKSGAAGCADGDGKGSQLKATLSAVKTVAFTPKTATGIKSKSVKLKSAKVPATFKATTVCTAGGC